MVSAVILAALLAAGASTEPPVSIRDLIEMTDLSSPSISSDGKMVAFREETGSIEHNDYNLGWYVVPVDGNAPPRRIAGAGEGYHASGAFLAAPVAWTAASTAIIFSAIIDGQVQLWRARVDGSNTEQITHEAGNVRDFRVGPDGVSVTYTTGAPRDEIAREEQREYDQGVLIDRHVDPARNLYRDGRIDGRWASTRLTGVWFTQGGLFSNRDAVFHTLDLTTLIERPATAVERSLVQPPAQSFDMLGDQQVIARADSGDSRGAAMILSRDGKGQIVVSRTGSLIDAVVCQQCQAEAAVTVSWQQNADRVLVMTTDDAGGDTLHLWDVASNHVQTLMVGDGLLNGSKIGDQGCAIGGATVVCVAASANVPPHLIAIDIGSGAVKTLADPNRGLIRPGQPTVRTLRWSDRAGHHFSGALIAPVAQDGAVPLFVTYYSCGGYLRGGTGEEYPLRQFAEKGIAALCINRASGIPGFHDQTIDYRVALSGIEAIIDQLAAKRVVDRRRIGIGGISFGGEVALWAAIHSRLFSALSLATSNTTPTFYWFNALPGRDAPEILRRSFRLGSPDRDPGSWRRFSAAGNADRLRAPVLMQEPEEEYRVNVELAARLGEHHVPVELWAFPEESHIKYQPRHRLAAANRYLDWFRYWLLDYVDHNPTKTAQYQRWRAFSLRPGWHDADASN
ncbi:Atxe2 family lasso peptide isopeptidase [Sphingomonas koreensis]|nr:Atxe2 family lasso peptide isopeptidase [Sphingomonas koreensis]